VTATDYQTVIGSSMADRRDLFATTSQRLGTTPENVEKDFWVCWVLDALYHRLPAGSPRLLFKGGTSLSKAHNLIQRFSEDVDVTVFREDLDGAVADMERMTKKAQHRELDAIREKCRAYIADRLKPELAAIVAEATGDIDRVVLANDDAEGQTLIVRYPAAFQQPANASYIQPVVRIESGAKSALDPHSSVTITPYVARELPQLDLSVPDITTIDASRTFWDKITIAHGLTNWFASEGALRNEGARVSRHYYDLHCLHAAGVSETALANRALGADCVRHAQLFFDRPKFNLAKARGGGFDVMPTEGMRAALQRDYVAMSSMIFGEPPAFDDVLNSVREIDAQLRRGESPYAEP